MKKWTKILLIIVIVILLLFVGMSYFIGGLCNGCAPC